jgi:hypothetical protein
MRNAVYDSAEMTAASRGLSDDKPLDIGDQRETFCSARLVLGGYVSK